MTGESVSVYRAAKIARIARSANRSMYVRTLSAAAGGRRRCLRRASDDEDASIGLARSRRRLVCAAADRGTSLDLPAFRQAVMAGRTNGISVMKGFANDGKFGPYIEDIFAYLLARADGALGRGCAARLERPSGGELRQCGRTWCRLLGCGRKDEQSCRNCCPGGAPAERERSGGAERAAIDAAASARA